MSEAAMIHGIEISPFVTERTIGPDLSKWQEKDEVEQGLIEIENSSEKNSPKAKCSPTCRKEDISPSNITNIDLQSIKVSVLLRDANCKQKAKVRELLHEVIKNRPVQQSPSNSFKQWLEKKKAAESEILQQAKADTERQLEENRRQLAALQEHTQLMVAQLQKKAAKAKKAQEELLLQQQKQQQIQVQQQREQEEEQRKKLQQQQQLREQQENRAPQVTLGEVNTLEQQQQLNAVTQQQSNAAPQQQPKTKKQSKKIAFISDIATPERLNFHASVNAVYHTKLENSRTLQADEYAKSLKNIYKKTINAPINAICAVSGENLNDKYMRILGFFNGQPVNNSDITINSHPLGRDYCILLMARKFVSQADSAISCNPQAAFPIASVIIALWQHLPDFGATFLAHLYEESPFLLPRFVTPKQGQDTVDYLQLIGYRLIETGILETHDDFLKRQTGLSRLYAALMVTNGRKSDAAQHPYGLQEAWIWLVNFVRLDPLPDISATLLLEILQIVSADMWTTYGKQFTKLLFHIQQHYMRKLDVVDKGGPKARLQLLLNNFLNKGQVTRPAGMLPPDFW